MDIDKTDIKKFAKTVGLLLLFFIIVFIIVSILATFLFNIIFELLDKTFIDGKITDMKEIDLSISTITSFATIMTYKSFFNIIMIIAFFSSVYFTYKIKVNYGNLNKNQKGRSRFATLKEIQAQYREVPDKAKRFEGSGGVPVGRYKDNLYIDDSPVNNLIIGTTRSGKGETVVFSTIDIYSRAREQSSMIVNDPKGELVSASKDTLEDLGYNVEVLNLMTPEQSMSYNILDPTKEAFLNNDMELAVRNARSVGYMLYNDPHAKDPVWWKSSASLCTALILGLCEQCKDEPEKINMYNVALMLSDLGSREVRDENGNIISALDNYFLQFPSNHPAKLQFSTVKFSSAQMRASILANTNSELDIFTIDDIAKLTSQTTFNTNKVGYKRWLKGIATPNKRITFTFPDGSTETTKTNTNGVFSIYFDSDIKKSDELSYQIGEVKESFKINGYEDKEQGKYSVTNESDVLNITELVQYKKPTAIFMVTPDYDASLNIIVSIFIKQVYTELARIASSIKGGKCQREVIYLLDEFGNMPSIEDFTNIITVCLGRNIRFNLVIQAYSQLEDKYGEGWKTIDGNCGNIMYLLTADEDTAERISKKLGDKTIVTKSRTGQPVSLSKSKTESVDSQRLLPSADVMALKEGEMLVIRVIKRQDKKRKRIRSNPIFLTGKTALKYRFEYLADYYDTDKAIDDYDIECKHATLNLNELKADFSENRYYEENLKESKQINEPESQENEQSEQSKEDQSNSEIEENNEQDDVTRKKEEREQKIKEHKQKLQKERAKRIREQKLHKQINERVLTSEVIEEGLLHSIFEGEIEKVEKYKNVGLIDFKDYFISISEDIDESFVNAILTKIKQVIAKEERDIKEENNKR